MPFEPRRRGRQPVRLLVCLALGLLFATPARAQRIPDVAVWFAGAALLAPLIAVPIKLGILRLRKLDAQAPLWSISALEWVLWFPVAFAALQFGRSPPLIVLALFFSAVFLHRARVANASWGFALILSLPTPLLALALPLLAFGAAAFVRSLIV